MLYSYIFQMLMLYIIMHKKLFKKNILYYVYLNIIKINISVLT